MENAIIDEMLARVLALAPPVANSLTFMEREVRLPPDIMRGLISAGIFRAGIPKAYGGYELDPMSQMRLVENVLAWTVR